MIQDGKLRGFAMGHAIAVRTDYTTGEVRWFAQRAKDAAQARRLLAIAAVLEGASREGAAKIFWFQDEMRVGPKNKLTYCWARKGSCPRAALDQRIQSTYQFGAVCFGLAKKVKVGAVRLSATKLPG